jgi:hypothetical protein
MKVAWHKVPGKPPPQSVRLVETVDPSADSKLFWIDIYAVRFQKRQIPVVVRRQL